MRENQNIKHFCRPIGIEETLAIKEVKNIVPKT